MSETLRRQVLQALINVSCDGSTDLGVERLGQEAMSVLTGFEASIGANELCSRVIEFGWTVDMTYTLPKGVFGPKIKEKPLLISQIAHAIEDREMPEVVCSSLGGNLSESEWDAATRFITLLLGALDTVVS